MKSFGYGSLGTTIKERLKDAEHAEDRLKRSTCSVYPMCSAFFCRSKSPALKSFLLSAVMLALVLVAVAPAQQTPEPPALALGQAVEREMAPGQRHAYQVTLTAGQYVEIEVQQRRLDVVLTLFGPDGKKLLTVDGPGGRNGLEQLIFITDAPGTHRLEIHPLEKDAPAGHYIAMLRTVRPETLKDWPLIEARRLLADAIALQFKGQYDEAIPLAEAGLRKRIELLGPDDQAVALAHDRLGTIHHQNGDFTKAVAAHREGLRIRESRFGPDHLETALSAHNLALDYKALGDHVQAESLFRRALTTFEQARPPNPRLVATATDQLASVYLFMGDAVRAKPLFQRALDIREAEFGPNHLETAISLNNFATFYLREKQYEHAIALHRRALAIKTKLFGANHPEIAITLDNLASVYFLQGEVKQAKQAFQQALGVLEKINNRSIAFGLADTLNGLAMVHQREGQGSQAEPLYQRSLAIRQEILGAEHPLIVESLVNLYTLYRDRKDAEQAKAFLTRAQDIQERLVAHHLLAGSERQKLAYLDQYIRQVSQAISLHVQLAPSDAEARRLAVEALLRRKGRVLDGLADNLGHLRQRARPEDQALLDQLAAVRSRLAALTLRGPEFFSPAAYRAKLKSLGEQMETLEGAVSARGAAFESLAQPVTLAQVQRAIPPGAALVEFALYSPYDWQVRNLGDLRYVAYVLRPDGGIAWADLGEAAAVDRMVHAFRAALRNPGRSDVRRMARQADEAVMRRLRPLLGGARQVFLSPDGALGLLPFAALADEQGRYLVERYAFSYLTSGRDLLRTGAPGAPGGAPLIVADPAFGEPSPLRAARGIGLQAGAPANVGPDFSRAVFRRLPATAEEARMLARLLPRASTLTGAQATEAALRQVSRPDILHIATHGFFLPDAGADPAGSRGVRLGEADANRTYVRTMSAEMLLRSGLVLAGANQPRSGDDDGIMTALELAGLDLWGTKLAVLSACNTGVGEVKRGEGVYGLRRALVLAGAETQVISLWPVADRGTRDLMTAYYRALLHGEGRGEALRQVQLRLLRGGTRRHPYYWASFIQSGDWRRL
jgi:CHAT domain-containing protein/tetratricopeptide (TPR) repeat protein